MKIAFHTVSPVPGIPDAVSGFLLFPVFLGSAVRIRLIDFVFPADVGAHTAEFFLYALVAPVQVIDAAYLRGALFPVFLGSAVRIRLIDFVFPADVGAHTAEFFLYALVAPVQVIDAAYLRGALGGETGQDERGGGA